MRANRSIKTITGKHVCQSYKIKEDLKNEMKEKSINTIKWGIFSRLSDNEKILWLQLNWSPTAASQLINMWQLWVSNMKVRSWSNVSLITWQRRRQELQQRALTSWPTCTNMSEEPWCVHCHELHQRYSYRLSVFNLKTSCSWTRLWFSRTESGHVSLWVQLN